MIDRPPAPQLEPDDTPEHAARWIALASPAARRALYEAYVSLFVEEDPGFDVAGFAERVRREMDRLRAERLRSPPIQGPVDPS